jgi:hypothetical protein
LDTALRQAADQHRRSSAHLRFVLAVGLAYLVPAGRNGTPPYGALVDALIGVAVGAVVVVGRLTPTIDAPMVVNYPQSMTSWNRCKAIVVLGRTPAGGRAGLVPPRHCQRVAQQEGEYCEVHEGQASLQDLYRALLGFGWELRVERYEGDQRRAGAAAHLRR